MGELGDKVEGELKDAGGKLTGDRKMEWEGKAQKAKGKVEEIGRKMTEDERPVADPAMGEPAESEKGL